MWRRHPDLNRRIGGFADLCLTTWLCRHLFWSGKRDLNPRLQPWQGCTLPLSYSRSKGSPFTFAPTLSSKDFQLPDFFKKNLCGPSPRMGARAETMAQTLWDASAAQARPSLSRGFTTPPVRFITRIRLYPEGPDEDVTRTATPSRRLPMEAKTSNSSGTCSTPCWRTSSRRTGHHRRHDGNRRGLRRSCRPGHSRVRQGLHPEIARRERKLIKKIQQALTRIDEGEFGSCVECGEEIGIARLKAPAPQ